MAIAGSESPPGSLPLRKPVKRKMKDKQVRSATEVTEQCPVIFEVDHVRESSWRDGGRHDNPERNVTGHSPRGESSALAIAGPSFDAESTSTPPPSAASG